MKLIFATQNQHKRDEVQALLGNSIQILSLADLQFHQELPETHDTLEENALEKAVFISNKFSMDCFSEDTGLEIAALNGAPGVYSARYAGEGKNPEDNIQLVFQQMNEKENRSAQFRTVVCLLLKNEPHFFEGMVAGTITKEQTGVSGFGYDPIFIPEGYDRTFAAMTKEEKNEISHRRRAIDKMSAFLKKQAD
ncbi:MAG: RdgB/HAM1 family non-canonical purine NTP pyrophosphatase [Chitinophagales bacterium]